MSLPSTQSGAPPHVLLVTGAYFPEIGSAGLQCQAIARHLAGRIEFRVLTTAVDRSLPAHDTIEGVPVSRIGVDVSSRASRARATIGLLAELWRIVRGVDVVHLHGWSRKNLLVIAMAKVVGARVLLSLHTAGFDEPETIVRQGRFARWAFGAADLYLAVSPRLVDACLAAGVSPDVVRHVPNGVDEGRFRPATSEERAELQRAMSLSVDRPVILFVGFFSREKQPQVLFDAWLRLQAEPALASTLVFVGATRSAYFEVDESLASEMRGRADRAGVADRLIFVDPTHRVEDYYRAADLFALPSSREGLPISLLEAMASGLPPIASRLAGATDALIHDGDDGLLVPPGDVAALAQALRALLTDRARAAAMGAAARARVVRDYGIARTANQWLEAYGHA